MNNLVTQTGAGPISLGLPKYPVLQKLSRPIAGTWKERMTIKRFKTTEEMYAFQNKQDNNNWTISNHDLKSGVYAFAGGQWHNVKSLDPSILAHI